MFRIDDHTQRFVREFLVRLLILRFGTPVVLPMACIRELSLAFPTHEGGANGSREEASVPEASHEVICPLLIFLELLFELRHLELTFVEPALAIIAVHLVVQVLVDGRDLAQ